ncbi:hypothetical protein CALVIDRAFT_337115 [Calocera viscosa TUFC12733]|uniref:Uncharacterized protein n=1 Tax=Calocera viscosa (strain TUFC12733) TaxID=1330018 RepID=A0A167HJ46_CALVF|nr:hypothetical protein CALVIDRAFT_337115 [Calocera viscosa TUFC12733]
MPYPFAIGTLTLCPMHIAHLIPLLPLHPQSASTAYSFPTGVHPPIIHHPIYKSCGRPPSTSESKPILTLVQANNPLWVHLSLRNGIKRVELDLLHRA